MYDNILETYKFIILEKETTKINLELLLSRKEYLSTTLDRQKEEYCDLSIKAAKKHLDECEELYRKLYDFLSNRFVKSLSYVETMVFKECIMKDKSAKQIAKKINLAEQTIYNTKSQLIKRLESIKVKREF